MHYSCLLVEKFASSRSYSIHLIISEAELAISSRNAFYYPVSVNKH